jgi:hypothetical protein
VIVTLPDNVTATPDRSPVADLSGAEFLDALADETGTPSLECATKEDKFQGPGFILARYRTGARSKQLRDLHHDSETEVFCFDIDDMTCNEVAEAIPVWDGYSAVLYSTWKHTPEAPRLRLLVELSEPVPNREREPYEGLWKGAAEALGVKYDPSTVDRAHLYFGPQHKPGAETVRHRFTGKPLDIKKVTRPVVADTGRVRGEQDSTFDVAQDRPSRQELSKVAAKWRKAASDRRSKLGTALEAILAGRPYAPAGSVHNTTLNLAHDLLFEWPRLDADWFAQKILSKAWESMPYEGSSLSARVDAWAKAIESGKAKHASYSGPSDDLTEDMLAELERLRGRWVVSHRRSYYVYDARCRSYKGPYASGEVPVAVRDHLRGVPGVSETSKRSLKSSVELCHEYGCTVDSVIYFADRPPMAYDAESDSICLQAYKWIRWEPVYHEIADELLRAMAGEHYEILERYLSRFRDLSQPLPALTLVGPRQTWKSRTCEILCRYWGNKDAITAARAEKVMDRFNGGLLRNPVVWSDEALAVTWQGKPKPEAYRESISAKSHSIEEKGVETVSLMTALRHMISVNDDAKVFSSEVDADSIHATMERFLLIYCDSDAIQAFESRWRGTRELDRLREGDSLLEHVRWIEQNRHYESQGRLFVEPHTEAQVLMRARFADPLLNCIWGVCFKAIEDEVGCTVTGQEQRLPLALNRAGEWRLNPNRVVDLWTVSKVPVGTGLRKPSTQQINQIMMKAGFKSNKDERGALNGFRVDHGTLNQFITVSESVSKADLVGWIEKITGIKPNDF